MTHAGGKVTAKGSVQHALDACRAFCSAGTALPELTPSLMRRAKLNDPATALPLWGLLGALHEHAGTERPSRGAVVESLAARGFVSLSAVPTPRRLLIAIAFCTARFEVLERYGLLRPPSAPPLPPYAATTAGLHPLRRDAGRARAPRRDDGSVSALLESAHAIAQLHGALRMSAQALSLSLDANARRLGELRRALDARAAGADDRRTMSAYEAHLLREHRRGGTLLRVHRAEMLSAARARELARGFWRWMDGVLALEEKGDAGEGDGKALDRRATGNAKQRLACARDVYSVAKKRAKPKAQSAQTRRAREELVRRADTPTAAERSAVAEGLQRVRALRTRVADWTHDGERRYVSERQRNARRTGCGEPSLAAALWVRALASAAAAAATENEATDEAVAAATTTAAGVDERDAEARADSSASASAALAIRAATVLLPLDLAGDEPRGAVPPPASAPSLPSASLLRRAAQTLARARSEQARRHAERLEVALSTVMVSTREKRWAIVGL